MIKYILGYIAGYSIGGWMLFAAIQQNAVFFIVFMCIFLLALSIHLIDYVVRSIRSKRS